MVACKSRRPSVEIRSDQIRRPGYLTRNVCPALPKSPDALAPVTVEVVVVRTQCYRPTLLTQTGTRSTSPPRLPRSLVHDLYANEPQTLLFFRRERQSPSEPIRSGAEGLIQESRRALREVVYGVAYRDS